MRWCANWHTCFCLNNNSIFVSNMILFSLYIFPTNLKSIFSLFRWIKHTYDLFWKMDCGYVVIIILPTGCIGQTHKWEWERFIVIHDIKMKIEAISRPTNRFRFVTDTRPSILFYNRYNTISVLNALFFVSILLFLLLVLSICIQHLPCQMFW